MSSPLLHNELPTESNSGLGSVAPPTLSPLRPCDVKTSDLDAYAPAETKGETEDRLDTTTETKISAHSVHHLDSNAEQQNSHNEPSAPTVYELSDQLQAAPIDGAAPAAATGETSAAITSTPADAPPLQRAHSVNRKFAEADFDSLHEDEEQSAASTAADATSEPSASSGITADKPTLRLTGHVIEFFDGRPIEVSQELPAAAHAPPRVSSRQLLCSLAMHCLCAHSACYIQALHMTPVCICMHLF
jgi:hypothetical protein